MMQYSLSTYLRRLGRFIILRENALWSLMTLCSLRQDFQVARSFLICILRIFVEMSLGHWTILLHLLWLHLKFLLHLLRLQRTSRLLYTTVLSLNHLPQRRHSPYAFIGFRGTPNLPVIMMQ